MVKAKAGIGSATLSMAYAAARFTLALIRAMRGEPNVIESAYVMSNITKSKYFASPLLLGKNGIDRNLGLPQNMLKSEQEMVDLAIDQLANSIKKGEEFAMKN